MMMMMTMILFLDTDSVRVILMRTKGRAACSDGLFSV